MSDRQSQSALREWRRLFGNPVTAVIVLAVAALLAILGPFGTETRLTLGPRFAYWLVMVVATFSVGTLVNTAIGPRLPERWPLPLTISVLGIGVGLAITPVVTALNMASFGYWPAPADWPALLAQLLAIALIVTVIFQVLDARPSARTNDTGHSAIPGTPALLDRLPLDKRGPLVALSAEDHYTRIRTTRGEELLLIRLVDAISETSPTDGMRVHRSHWVATAHVTGATRDGDRAVLSMEHGPDIPVSRTHVPAVREAGLLPR